MVNNISALFQSPAFKEEKIFRIPLTKLALTDNWKTSINHDSTSINHGIIYIWKTSINHGIISTSTLEGKITTADTFQIHNGRASSVLLTKIKCPTLKIINLSRKGTNDNNVIGVWKEIWEIFFFVDSTQIRQTGTEYGPRKKWDAHAHQPHNELTRKGKWETNNTI